MQKGATFIRNGAEYEVLQSGLDFIDGQKSCIRPNGERRCITIDKAEKQNLIRRCGLASKPGPEPAEGQLPLGYPEKGAEKSPSQDKAVTESGTTYDNKPAPLPAPQGSLFMPVDPLRAQVFLAHGLIYPSLYDRNGAVDGFNDSQSFSPGDLTLFSEMPPLGKGHIVLQIRVTPEEISDALKTASALRFQLPLPVSRLMKILVPVSPSKLQTYVAGWIKPDVPAPAHLFEAMQASEGPERPASTPDPQAKPLKPQPSVADSIARFDQLMGLFAFMRNAHRYISSASGFYSDYPDDFLTLSAPLFEAPPKLPQLKSSPAALPQILLGAGIKPETSAKGLVELLNSRDAFIDKTKARGVAKEIYESNGSRDDLAQAFKSLFDGDYRSAIRALQSRETPPEATLLAGLFKFSNRQSNDHRNVKQRLHEEWTDPSLLCQFTAMLGYYYGYTALDASEKQLYSVDPVLAPLIDQAPPIKFQLATHLERSLVEALYQWTFFHRRLDASHAALFDEMPQRQAETPSPTKGFLVKDLSFRVADLHIRRYEITLLARLLQRLRALPGDMIDERSEVGRYFFRDCFDIADENEKFSKKGTVTRRFRMSKARLCDLVADQQISVNPRVLDACISEDSKSTRP